MDPHALQRLTARELDSYVSDLDQAVENHICWLGRINKTLLYRLAPEPADIAADPHRHCMFGRWYHAVDHTALLSVPEFSTINDVHEQLHAMARALLCQMQQGQAPDPADYDRLNALSDELRHLIGHLRGMFKRNINLISTLMGKVFENATEGVMITGPDSRILNVNKAFTEVTGYSHDEVMGQTPALLNSGRQGEAFYRHMWKSLQETGHWEGEIWNRRKDGKDYLEWLTITAVKDTAERLSHYVAVFSDITSEKENEERLYRLAHYDLLTQLPNRMLFYDRLKQGMSRARRGNKRVAVLFLDLDGFKAVNDELGHHAGDDLLRQVAKRLRAVLRASDTLSRFGGDEFTVAIPDLGDDDDISQVALKLIATVGQPYQLNGHQVRLSTSIGISLFPQDGTSADSLVTHADAAMYETKKAGKNGFRFYATG